MDCISGLCVALWNHPWEDHATKTITQNGANPAEVSKNIGKTFIPVTQCLGVWFLGGRTGFRPLNFFGRVQRLVDFFRCFFLGGGNFWCKICFTGRYVCFFCNGFISFRVFCCKFIMLMDCVCWQTDFKGDRSATFSPQKPTRVWKIILRFLKRDLTQAVCLWGEWLSMPIICAVNKHQQTDWKQENGVSLGRALLSLVQLIELLQFFFPDVMLISLTLRTRCNITPTPNSSIHNSDWKKNEVFIDDSLSRYDQSSETMI